MKYPQPYFFGPEIEGRFYGLKTLFIVLEWPSEKEMQQVGHYYFPREFWRTGPGGKKTQDAWDRIDALVDGPRPVTLEVELPWLSQIPDRVFHKAHMLVKIDVPGLARLKSSDTLCLTHERYHAFMATMWQMQQVKPEHYAVDHAP